MFIRTRWIKIFKDIWNYRTRSMLVIFSIAVGVASVGMITNASYIIQRDLYGQYAEGNPAYLQLFISPFEKDLVWAVGGMREVEAVDARRIVSASISPNDQQRDDLSLHALADYKNPSVNRYTLVEGHTVPNLREILLERQSAKQLGLTLGDLVSVEMPDGREYVLTVSGIVHDVYVMPMALLGEATGYVSMETLEWMGEHPYFNRMDVVTTGRSTDKNEVLATGSVIRDRVVEPAGYTVGSMRIPGIGSDPGSHWAQNQIKGFLLILQIMGVLTVFLSGGLVINTVSAILSQQIKQIGIMRSFGASRMQLVVLYLVNVLVFSIIGMLLAIPLGMIGAWGLSEFAASFINFDITVIDLPPQVMILQLLLGLLMPISVASVPVLNGVRISVYEAIYQYGLGADEQESLLARVLGKIRKISPPVVLSLRNTFRKKARLVFTLITLTLAGAMFIAAFSTRASLNQQISDSGRYIYFDAAISFSGGASKYAIEREALRIPEVSLAEAWGNAMGVYLRDDGTDSQEFEVIGLPQDAKTIQPMLVDGTWLSDSEQYQVVVNQDFLEEDPDVFVGSLMEIKIGESKKTFQVIGVVSKHLSGPRVYMVYDDFERIAGRQGQADQVRVLVNPGGPSEPATQDRIANLLEERFDNASYGSGSSTTRHSFISSFTDVFNIILIVLIVMAGILAVVGGLGLTGAMGMNVLERTREIGVLRAVGASNFTVRQVVVIEGVVVGVISWVMGAIVSAPSGWVLASAVIYAVLKTQPRYHYSFIGSLVWFGLVVLIGVFSSLAPAHKASQLQVREVLDYE
jgi:putative ABC transport system permease protein